MQVQTDHPVTQREHDAVDTPSVYALLAEFEDVDSVMNAARAVRGAGYERFDVHSPFPIHGIDDVIGIRPTILPWIVLLCGLAGGAGGLVLVIWTMSIDYPYLISGKPLNSMPAWIPIVFECVILLSAFGAVFGMFLLNKLPMLYDPLSRNERFRRVTSDRFFVTIEARDRRFDLDRTRELLESQGASAVEVVED